MFVDVGIAYSKHGEVNIPFFITSGTQVVMFCQQLKPFPTYMNHVYGLFQAKTEEIIISMILCPLHGNLDKQERRSFLIHKKGFKLHKPL